MPLAAFDPNVRAIADVEAFGLVFQASGLSAELCTRHRTGVAAHRLPVGRLPAPLRPSGVAGPVVVPVAHMTNPEEVFADRLRLYGVESVAIVPLPEGAGVFWAGKGMGATVTEQELAAFVALAGTVAEACRGDESLDEAAARLARLAQVDGLLPVLGAALDVREVFSRLSEVAKAALPHQVATIQVLEDDHVHARLYALDGASTEGVPEVFSTRYPAVFSDHFLFTLLDDVLASESERDRPAAKAGMRSALRVPIWLDGRVGGALEFSAAAVGAFHEADVAVARRIADCVAVAISHYRLAERARRAAAMEERTRTLHALDELLPTLSGVLDFREVFDQVSAIARQVIPHDALGLPLVTEDGGHVIRFATTGVLGAGDPTAQTLPEGARYLFESPWEWEVFEDAREAHQIGWTTYPALGFASVLRVPVRLEGRTVGVLVFLSRTRRAYTEADVVAARRIAGHMALALSHERLAEQARRHQVLRARAARLELLDQVLASVTACAELSAVFGRVSEVARRVIEHDALVLTTVNPDRRTGRVYASQAPDAAPFPDRIELAEGESADPAWEHELVDDLQARDAARLRPESRLGYRSAIRVAIRLEGQYLAAISFLAFSPRRYGQADVVVARRIADRLALSIAHERQAAASARADQAAARVTALESRVRDLSDELDARTGYRQVLGESAPWRAVLTQATQVAATDTTALLLGESGTGKEVVARFIHRASRRQQGPFVALNCAALPEHLLEAELFGYERGAFTGATQSKPGQLELAGGGTLFLDEVAEMRPAAQAKFLRVLQEREFQRLGGTRVLRADARIVAATNRNLRDAIARGDFREDVFYRLNVFAIQLPPLRERTEDVLALSQAFLAEYGRSLGRPPSGISRDARQHLLEYRWPGNVRELRNVLERAAILCDGGLITAAHLGVNIAGAKTPGADARSADPSGPAAPSGSPAQLPALEKAMIEHALQRHRFNKSKAAQELGLTRAQLYVRLKRHGLK